MINGQVKCKILWHLHHLDTHCGAAEPGPGHQSTASADLRKQQKQLHFVSSLGERQGSSDRAALLFMWSDSETQTLSGLEESPEAT